MEFVQWLRSAQWHEPLASARFFVVAQVVGRRLPEWGGSSHWQQLHCFQDTTSDKIRHLELLELCRRCLGKALALMHKSAQRPVYSKLPLQMWAWMTAPQAFHFVPQARESRCVHHRRESSCVFLEDQALLRLD